MELNDINLNSIAVDDLQSFINFNKSVRDELYTVGTSQCRKVIYDVDDYLIDSFVDLEQYYSDIIKVYI